MTKRGRKTKFTEDIAKRICDLIEKDTYTVAEICESVGICRDTFFSWKNSLPDFSDAIKKAEEKRRETFVVEAKNSILKKIRGYKVTEIKNVNAPTGETDSEGNPVLKLKEQTTITKYVQPDTTAIIFTLTNLDPEHWKNRQNIESTQQGEVRFTGFPAVLPVVEDIEKLTEENRRRFKLEE